MPPTIYSPRPGVIITVRKTLVDSIGLYSPHTRFEDPFECACQGMESLLLAMSAAGVPMDTPQMHEAVATALDAIANHLGDD